jgi:hypothetical protein
MKLDCGCDGAPAERISMCRSGRRAKGYGDLTSRELYHEVKVWFGAPKLK